MNAQVMKLLKLFPQYIYFHVPCIPKGNLSLETEFIKSLETVCSMWYFQPDQNYIFSKIWREICSVFDSKATL